MPLSNSNPQAGNGKKKGAGKKGNGKTKNGKGIAKTFGKILVAGSLAGTALFTAGAYKAGLLSKPKR